MKYPVIIQGGMGVGISDWRLARAVAQAGQLGVVSGTGLSTVLVRRLQDGDRGGHMRRALGHFPLPELAARVLERYFIPGGKSPARPYALAPMYAAPPSRALELLTAVAAFAEVSLAKEGHAGVVGMNLLEKIQLPNPSSLYGAMLAGVDYVLMGAGIPREIPGILDGLALHRPVSLKLAVDGEVPEERGCYHFDPQTLLGHELPPLKRPLFLAIIASTALATALIKKSTGRVDGFVVEAPTAGGHNAPPRGPARQNARGEPLYGLRDEVDLAQIRALGRPFWLAGGCAEPARLQQALAAGAQGVQLGTAFALCDESGLSATLKAQVIAAAARGDLEILTDPAASPTGFPFKLAQLADTLAEHELYVQRPRRCDLGYLRTPYARPDGTLGFRCPAEPVAAYVAKGGAQSDTEGRKCLCNGLLATAGLPQQQGAYLERPLLTLGDDIQAITRCLPPGQTSYAAREVLSALLGPA
ncbi:MAG TPA: nitronate monooxygenase [Herpetosiphonaceae bacterium]